MRIRSIKPEFWRSEDITSLPLTARLTFIGLWNYVDDNGVGVDRESVIAADLYADDLASNPHETSVRVHGDLLALENVGLIVRYMVGRKHLLHISTWEEHQVINRPSKGHGYPLPTAETCQAHEDYMSTHGGLTEGSPPEQGNRGAGEQGNRGTGEQGNRDKDLAQPSGSSEPDPFDEFWTAYPRRVGKQKARGKFTAAVKRAGDAETVIRGARRLAADPNLPEQQFIPHPTTWLERNGWEDDPLPPRLTTTNTSAEPTGYRPEHWRRQPPPEDPGDYVDGEVVDTQELEA